MAAKGIRNLAEITAEHISRWVPTLTPSKFLACNFVPPSWDYILIGT